MDRLNQQSYWRKLESNSLRQADVKKADSDSQKNK